MRNETRLGSGNVVFQVEHLGRVRLGSIRNKDNWNNASKRLFGSYSHSGIPEFPFRLFYSHEQNSRIIFGKQFYGEWPIPLPSVCLRVNCVSMIFDVVMATTNFM